MWFKADNQQGESAGRHMPQRAAFLPLALASRSGPLPGSLSSFKMEGNNLKGGKEFVLFLFGFLGEMFRIASEVESGKMVR